MRVTLIHNASAGTGRVEPDELIGAIAAAGHEVAYRSRKDPGLEAAIAAPADAIVLAGGDGTISKLLPLLVERGLPISILPLGTANNIATSLGISGSVDTIARTWNEEGTRRLDIGCARGPWGEHLFLDGIGVGALAKAMVAMHEADGATGDAKLEQARQVIRKAIEAAQPADFAIADGRDPLPSDLLFVEITNLSCLGPNLGMAPAADPGDGLFDIVFARAEDRSELVAWLEEGGSGAGLNLQTRRAGKITIDQPGDLVRVADGFERAGDSPCTVEVMGRSLRLLAPMPDGGSR